MPNLTKAEKADARVLFEAGAACEHCIIPGVFVGSFSPTLIEATGAGSQVFGIDGRAHTAVNAVVHDYSGPVRTITARGSLPVTVTDEHQFLVFPALWHGKPGRAGWKWRQRIAAPDEQPVWKRADELAVGDCAVSPLPRLEGPEPPERWESAEACWLLGLLCGDGWVSRRKLVGGEYACYHIGCVLSDADDVERAVEIYRSFGLKPNAKDCGTYWRLVVSSRDYAEDVHAFIGLGSANKRLPAFVWSSKERLAAAISGAMAADGTLLHPKRTPHRTSHRLFTTSQALGWQAWAAALALGERPCIRPVNRKPGSGYANAKPAWTVEWSDCDAHLFTARTEEFYVMPIRKIEAGTYSGPVHDLTVQDVHSFTASGLLTHNCGGIHHRACPRVRRKSFHPNGNLIEVEYWRKYDPSGVIFPEDAYDPDDPDDAEGT